MIVDFEFGAKDSLPAKVIYQRKDAEGKELPEEDRMAQYIAVGGILVPYVIDHFRAGVQTSRINYESVEFNAPVADALFTRPANAKAVK
jgi:outer membrane lipoprotein-sorting protein